MVTVEDCPKCLGASDIMEANETRGFTYVKCPLCSGRGKVPSTIAEDFISSNTIFDDGITDFFDDSH